MINLVNKGWGYFDCGHSAQIINRFDFVYADIRFGFQNLSGGCFTDKFVIDEPENFFGIGINGSF